MKEEAFISDLHFKFSEKTWNDTFQLVRRCTEKFRDESKPCEPLVRSLERLQEVLHAPSVNATRSRLEIIAKQQGMGFHTTEATCYLTADLFYVEVLLLACGEVQEVKVAPHGKPPVPSESLLQLLRSQRFADFSTRLGGLFAQYNIPGDNEIKFKLLTSLQHLGKDFQQISDLPREPKHFDPKIDLINNGRVGLLTAGKEDYPLTIQFYIHPADGVKTSESSDLEPVVQATQVTVGVSSVTHKLPMASVILQPPELDPQGCPMVSPLSEVPNEMLPACFLLRLQPSIPLMFSFVERLQQITDVVPDFDLQWAPLPKLLLKASQSSNPCWKTFDEQEIFTVPLPGNEMHSYILPGAAWHLPTQRATVVDSVPFTHPAHVPALLELLRHQCAINTLLRSCFSIQSASPGLICDLHFEVLPESATSFSVTFQQPHADSLAVLLVNVSNPHQITCKLFGAGKSGSSLDDYISTVMKSCMSIPLTMRTLYSRLEEITSGPASPSCQTTTEAENDHLSPAMDSSGEPLTVSRSAAVPEDSASVSDSACSTKSELLSEINTSTPVNPYLSASVCVFPQWVASNGAQSELS